MDVGRDRQVACVSREDELTYMFAIGISSQSNIYAKVKMLIKAIFETRIFAKEYKKIFKFQLKSRFRKSFNET